MNEPLLDRRERAAAPSGAPGFALWNLGFACSEGCPHSGWGHPSSLIPHPSSLGSGSAADSGGRPRVPVTFSLLAQVSLNPDAMRRFGASRNVEQGPQFRWGCDRVGSQAADAMWLDACRQSFRGRSCSNRRHRRRSTRGRLIPHPSSLKKSTPRSISLLLGGAKGPQDQMPSPAYAGSTRHSALVTGSNALFPFALAPPSSLIPHPSALIPQRSARSSLIHSGFRYITGSVIIRP